MLPAGLATVTITGTWLNPDGTPRTGTVTFEPEPAILTSAEHGVLILGPITTSLDGTGSISVEVLATDDPDVTPTDWTYQVTERWPGITSRSYPLSLPLAAPDVDLAEVAPAAAASEGDFLVITGPEGPEGSQGPAGPQGDPGDPGEVTEADMTAAIATHAATDDPHGDRAYGDATFATVVVVDALSGTVTALQGDVSAIDGFVNDLLTRVINIEQGTAFLAGANFTAPVLVHNTRVEIRDSGANPLHRLDGNANQIGFHGAAPVSRQTITGSRSDGTALASLLTALAARGDIIDNTTA